MDINSVVISGRVYGMGFSPTIDPKHVGVAEGILRTVKSVNKDGVERVSEIPIRAYGKKALWMSRIPDDTSVTAQGNLCEDIRINSEDPRTSRSKIYIDVICMKTLGGRND